MIDFRYRKIPAALKAEPRWLVWKLESRTNKDGSVHVTKVPYRADRPWHLASSTVSDTWGSFQRACDAVAIGQADGIGFALGDGYIGIDIDHCRDARTNTITNEAQVLIDEMNSYTEASPSGTGVHILLRGTLAGGCKQGGVECYGDGRYFTMTGQQLGVADLQARPAAIAALVARLSPPPPPRKDGKPRQTRKPKPTPEPATTLRQGTFASASSPGTTYVASYDLATRRGSCTCPGHQYRKFNRACRHLVELGAPPDPHTRPS